MSWSPDTRPSGSRLVLALVAGLVVLAAGLALAGVATARPNGLTGPRRPTAASRPATRQGTPAGGAGGAATVSAPGTTGTGGQSTFGDAGVASVPDDTQQLGGSDPLCRNPTELSALGQRNCRASGSPASAFPPGNYTPDVHVDTGITDPGNDIASTLQDMLAWVFSLMVTITHTALLGVSLAFGLDLFGSDHQQRIPHALVAVEHVFTMPWLPVAFAIGAMVGIVRWWGRRQEGRAISHWTLMIVCALAGLVITTDPQATVGQLDRFSDQAALATLAAFSDRNPGQPAGSYADATAGLWSEMVQAPWCAMEFADTQWCTSPLNAQTRQWRADALAHIAEADANSSNPPADSGRLQACARDATAGQPIPSGSSCWVAAHEALRLQDAQTNGELWLAFLANDDARNGKNDTWTLYHHLLQARPSLAQVRGPGGVADRLGILVLTGIGLGFFLLLLVYIAANLLLAGLFFIVLLLLAPVMLLFPCFGDRGRQAFARWLGYATGALMAKVIYAIYLGVLIFAFSLVAALGVEAGGWLLQWILFAGLWGLAFIYRRRMLALLSAGAHHEHHHGIAAATAGVGAIALTRAAGARAIAQPVRRARDEALDRRDQRRYHQDVRQARAEQLTVIEEHRDSHQQAQTRLGERARQLLDARYQQAQDTIAAGRASAGQNGSAPSNRRARPLGGANGSSIPRSQPASMVDPPGELVAAREFVGAADEHQRLTGQRYTPRQLADAQAAVEQELRTPLDQRDYQQLAYRLPAGRTGYATATEQERQVMRQRIDEQTSQDRELVRTAEHAGDLAATHKPVAPRPPRPRRPRPYQRHEFHGARQHMPPPSRSERR